MKNMMQAHIGLTSETRELRAQLSQYIASQNQGQQEKGKFPTQGASASANFAGGLQYQHPHNQSHEEAQAITTLRSGKEIDKTIVPKAKPAPPKGPVTPPVVDPEIGESRESPVSSESPEVREKEVSEPRRGEVPSSVGDPWVTVPRVPESRTPVSRRAPYPSRLVAPPKANINSHFFELLRRVQLPISLMEAIEAIPQCAKVLKELCTKHRKSRQDVVLTEQVSSILQTAIPAKCADPGSPTLTVDIAGQMFDNALLDLGASINLLPYSAYLRLGLGDLKATPVTIQLADRSKRVPKGMVEDVMVKVGDFCFPADFIVLDVSPGPEALQRTPIILGRPFLATSSAVMDCKTGKVQLSVGEDKMEVEVYNLESIDEDEEDSEECNLLNTLVEEHVETILYSDPLEVALTSEEESFLNSEVGSLVAMLDCEDECSAIWDPVPEPLGDRPPKVLPSAVQPPKPELKPLPDTLKYAFLKADNTFPVVISSTLEADQESRLLELLREHIGAIGWNVADLHGISPTMCTHRIILEEGAKPSRQPQRRLNPNMKEVVRAEVLKLLDAGIIYPIAHSEWVSPVQVVPKKAGVTVVTNDRGEEVPTRIPTGWRVCIDYRKLNASTQKDHFPFTFH